MLELNGNMRLPVIGLLFSIATFSLLSSFSRCRFLLFSDLAVDTLVTAFLVGAIMQRLFFFGHVFFQEERLLALRARLGDWFIPEYYIAIRVFGTAIECFSTPRF